MEESRAGCRERSNSDLGPDLSLSFLTRCLSTLLAPCCAWVLFAPPSGPELSGFSPRPAGALPGAGEEFPREQLNSARTKNSPGPGPKARGGDEGRKRRRAGQALILPAPPLHLDPGPGLGRASSLVHFLHQAFPILGLWAFFCPPFSILPLPSYPSLDPSGCVFSLYLPASDRARQRPLARTRPSEEGLV